MAARLKSMSMNFRVTYNAPVVLSFTLLCIVIQLSGAALGDRFSAFFTVSPAMNWSNATSYLRLFSHTLGHSGWEHLTGNLMFILLLGPILEEKYGSKHMLAMIAITALMTALAVIFIFKVGLHGASGLVFMLILLGSLVNFKSGEVPLTFILIAFLYFGKEVLDALQPDHISQFAHIIGGICGSMFGFGRKVS